MKAAELAAFDKLPAASIAVPPVIDIVFDPPIEPCTFVNTISLLFPVPDIRILAVKPFKTIEFEPNQILATALSSEYIAVYVTL